MPSENVKKYEIGFVIFPTSNEMEHLPKMG